MNIIKKVKAFFQYQKQDAELEVAEAIIKPGKVILRPAANPKRTVKVKAETVDIIINRNCDTQEEDIEITDMPETDSVPAEEEGAGEDFDGKSGSIEKKPLTYFIPKKKNVTFSLYPDEYEMLMENIHTNGYKKSEFLLACVTSAKKNSLDANYRKYTISHKERRAAERQAAVLAQEQDFLSQMEQTNEPYQTTTM